MARLRTNYKDGEELLAYDVNLITETINGLSDKADETVIDIDEINTEIEQANSEIDGIKERLDTDEANINTIINTTIPAIQNKDVEQDGRLDDAEEDLETLAQEINGLKDSKQDNLTAGANITINNNVISSNQIDDTQKSDSKTWSSEKINSELEALAGDANSDIVAAETIDVTFVNVVPSGGGEDGEYKVYVTEQADTLYKYENGAWVEQTIDANKLYFDTVNNLLYAYKPLTQKFAEVAVDNTIIFSGSMTGTAAKNALNPIKTPGVYNVLQHQTSSGKTKMTNWVMTVTYLDSDEADELEGSVYQKLESNYTVYKRYYKPKTNTWTAMSKYYEGLVRDSLTSSAYYSWSVNKIKSELTLKQDKLTAGANITIDEHNVISAASTDLSEYAKTSEVEEAIQDEADRVDEALLPITAKLSGIETGAQVNDIEVVKVNGTALPINNKEVNVTVPTKLTDLTNDGNFVKDASYVHTDNNFTTAEKNKLQGIANGAEVNVQSDWNVTDSSSDAYIKNKPQNLVQDDSYVHTDNNYTTTEKNKLAGIAAGAEVNVIEGVILSDSVSPLTPDANKNVTIPLVSTSSDGLMPAEDKAKLDGLEAYETATTQEIQALFVMPSFYVDNTQFITNGKMTWGQWLNSKYNTSSFTHIYTASSYDSSTEQIPEVSSSAYPVQNGQYYSTCEDTAATAPADDEIWYTTESGNLWEPMLSEGAEPESSLQYTDGGALLSNRYVNGHGVLKFTNNIETLNEYFGWDDDGNSDLTTITLPNSIASVGWILGANYECPNLESIYYNGTVDECSGIDWYSFAYDFGWDEIICLDGTYSLTGGGGSGSGSGGSGSGSGGSGSGSGYEENYED